MMVTTTAVGFLFLTLGLAFCGIRFFGAFQKIGGVRAGSKIGILLSSMFFSNALTVGILGTGALFFARDSEILFRSLLASDIPLLLTALLGTYLIFYILFPSVSPLPVMAVILALWTAVIILTVITHPRPFMDASRGIDWNASRVLAVPLSYLIFIQIGSPLIIFSHAFLRAKSREVKIVSVTQVALAFMGIINIAIRFLLPTGTANFMQTRVSDVMFTGIGLGLAGVVVLPLMLIRRMARIEGQRPFKKQKSKALDISMRMI